MIRMTTDALEMLKHMTGDDTRMQTLVEEEREKLRVARMIYDARTAAGLIQAELAARVGTRQSAISRLEDADYEGDTLTMLARVAHALDRRVEVRFLPPRRDAVNAAP